MTFKGFLTWHMMQILVVNRIMGLCQRIVQCMLKFRETQVEMIVTSRINNSWRKRVSNYAL